MIEVLRNAFITIWFLGSRVISSGEEQQLDHLERLLYVFSDGIVIKCVSFEVFPGDKIKG